MELPTLRTKPKFDKIHLVSLVVILSIALLTIGVATVTKKVADWGAEHQLVRQKVLELSLRLPYRIEKREPLQIVSPIVTEVLEQKEELTPIEKKIVDKWGERYGYIVLAIFRCESGLRSDAVNWSTKDLGVGQINWPTWEKPIKEKFGYTLVDMFDVDKNLEVAYWISDRDLDGEDIDLTPWVVFNTGSFRNCIQ